MTRRVLIACLTTLAVVAAPVALTTIAAAPASAAVRRPPLKCPPGYKYVSHHLGYGKCLAPVKRVA